MVATARTLSIRPARPQHGAPPSECPISSAGAMLARGQRIGGRQPIIDYWR